MRNAMFFPNRILYREELLSTTVTYAVDLDEIDRLSLIHAFWCEGGTSSYAISTIVPNAWASASASTAAPATASCTATPTDLKNVISSSD